MFNVSPNKSIFFVLVLVYQSAIIKSYEAVHLGHHDDTLLKWVKVAEENLRIYIYPIPSLPQHDPEVLFGPTGDHSGNFLAETYLINYFKDMGMNGSSKQKAIIVTDPDKANVFIINHHWMQGAMTFSNCSEFYDNHMLPIVNHVLMDQPYFNRSNGNDHFIIFLSDNGLFVDIFIPCITEKRFKDNIVRRLYNVSQISNYAKDLNLPPTVKTHSLKSFGDGNTFLVDKDITIPQSLESPKRYEDSLINDWPVFRTGDSAWQGWVNSKDRDPMANMATNAQSDYTKKHFEKFLSSRELQNAYFAYNPCGQGWCWSKRLYDSMSLKAIPIMAGSNLIMPFEKFIPWEKMTVKVSANTWENVTGDKLIAFRRRVRVECDKFRHFVSLLWESLRSSESKYGRGDQITSRQLHIPKHELSNSSISLIKTIHDTVIYSKMMAIHRNFGWLYWNVSAVDHRIPWKHPFKLIQLEMWCRVSTHEQRMEQLGLTNIGTVASTTTGSVDHSSSSGSGSKEIDLCLKPANKISKLEYF